MIYHDFCADLSSSFLTQQEPFWHSIYKQFFPNLLTITTLTIDSSLQRAGVDRSITLDNGKTITFDEKVRESTYPDILLEEWSNIEQRKEGWITKPMLADYIVYVKKPSKKAYLFNTLQLQNAWRVKGEAWKKQFKRVEARNERYTAINWAIPDKVILLALFQQNIIQF